MILIDSLYINNSGGLRLLEYLVKELSTRNIPFHLLADIRCKGIFDSLHSVEYMTASMRNRAKWYSGDMSIYSSVLCFGNIPVPRKLNIPVYTYFHNINLLTLKEAHGILSKVISWLKREVFKYYKKNTDYWLVQTSNTAKELICHLNEKAERVMLMPFYELPDGISVIANQLHGDDYVFVSVYVPGKGHEELLDAWRLLHRKGVDITLHLTVQKDSLFVEKIKEAQEEGVMVVNHGVIPFNEVFGLYKQSKAIIYPSHNESLGLGIVEAVSAGCDVIASDLPFTHSICKPSAVFNPYLAESIAEAVIGYEKGKYGKTELTIYNHINELVKIL